MLHKVSVFCLGRLSLAPTTSQVARKVRLISMDAMTIQPGRRMKGNR